MNIFKKKSLCAALAGMGALGATGAAQAVNLNPDGLGQVLIYPYYTTRSDSAGNAFNSLLSVVNSTASVKAVKVRFLEGKNSREVLDFNVFLSGFDVWTAALTPVAGGGTQINTADKSCVLPFGQFPQTFRTGLLGADGAGNDLDRTTEGYVEIIEMTTYSDASTTAGKVTHDGGVPPGCATLTAAEALADSNSGAGILGGLFGGMTLINVQSGSDYTQDAVALDNFATFENLYTGSADTLPDLASGSPPVSVTIADFGLVFTSDWSTSPNLADPVSAILMHDSIMNEFVLDAATDSGTDWVVTMPTKRFYVANGTGSASRLFQRNFNKTAGSCDDVSLDIFDREETTTSTPLDFSPQPEAGVNQLCWEANVVTFNNSNVLGSANVANITTSFENGWLDIGFFPETVTGSVHTLDNDTTTFVDPTVSPPFVSGTGPATYFGLPIVGFAVQSFANGAITVGDQAVLSNYGGNFVHKGTRFVGGVILAQ
jgi:hypothetical protein